MFGIVSLGRALSVAHKEVLHVLRDPATLFFALVIPLMELFLLGFAIDTNVRHVRTAVLDLARTQQSRDLLRSFETSEDFDVVAEVRSDEELNQLIVAGKARVGIKIPEDYSRRLQGGDTAQVLVLVDGSESSVAAEVVNVSNALALRESLKLALRDRPLPVEVRPRVLFNPDTRTANFIIPGLLVILCQIMATMLTTNAIVREKENGTLEQLYLTPVQPRELILGKLAPYLVLTFIDFFLIVGLMVVVFNVPVRGQVLTLAAITLPFVLTMLGFGLMISSRASSRDAAMHMVMGTFIPSIFLSGYVFPLDSLAWGFRLISYALPTTWLIDAARGIILRGAGWAELWVNAAVLWGMALAILTASILRFHKQS